jgi:hypothetical protein
MKYLKSFNENMALAKSIIAKKMDGFEKLKALLSKNIGYIGKFTDYLINENIPLSDLENLYKDLVDLKNKQKNIDISSLKYEEVIDKIQDNKNDLSVNSLIQQFPSEQKELARQLLNSSGNVPNQRSQTNYNLILQASKKEEKEALLSKIRRYKTKEDLLNALKLFGKTSFNDKEQIKEFLKTSKSNLSFENDDVMIVKVNSLEDVQKLGSDTSWCILGSSMWNSYTKGRYQFIIYDFRRDEWDPLFKIGFTLNKDFTIHAAHDILDSSSAPQLRQLISEQDIKFSELIPKAESIDITSDMIERINGRTTIVNLQNYADNVSKELLPRLLKKIVETTSTLTDGKRKIIAQLVNTYFADYDFVTNEDLNKIDPRLSKFNLGSRCLIGKRVTDRPEFDSNNLNPDTAVKMLNYWKEDALITAFASASKISDLFKIPGSHWLYSGDEFKFANSWNKEKVTKVSDKVNELWESGKWRKLNDYGKSQFNLVYVILNYALNRKDLVKPEAISNLSANNKVEYAYLLKMPIDLSASKEYFREINKWAVQFVVKKDYPDVKLYLEKPSVVGLVDKLIDNQLYFRLAKNQKDRVLMNIRGLKETPGSKKLIDTIAKFPRTARVGNKVTSDDGKITIELY